MNFGRGGGGGGRGPQGACERPMTQWDSFCARPAEAAPGRGAPQGANMAQLQERAAQLQGAAGNPKVQQIFALIGLPVPAQGGRGGFGGFGGGGGTASTGDYGVVLQIGPTVLKQTLRVENMGAAGSASPFGFDEDARDR